MFSKCFFEILYCGNVDFCRLCDSVHCGRKTFAYMVNRYNCGNIRRSLYR